MLKRSSDNNEGTVTKSLARGQTLQTPIGKDSSDWSGPASKEVTAKMKMGGSMTDTSSVDPKD